MTPLLALLLLSGAEGGAGGCTRVRAERVTLEALLADEAAWRGRCLAVRGIWSGEALYRTEHEARRRAGRRIRLSAPAVLAARSARPASYTAVGVLRPGPLLEASEMYRRSWPTAPQRQR